MNFSNGSPKIRQGSSKNKLQFRIHYKNNFKNVDQVAQEAQNNILALQSLPTNPTDFGLREHYYFENFDENDDNYINQNNDGYIPAQQVDYSNLNQNKEANKSLKVLPQAPSFEKNTLKKFEKLILDNFQQVIDQTEQAFDECYTKFENNIDTVMYGVTANPSQQIVNSNRIGEYNRPRTYQQTRSKKQQDDQEKLSKKDIKRDSSNNDLSSKRPVTAITYHAKFGKQARSLSPIKNESEEQNEIKSKWTNFLKETDRNLDKYEKIFNENTQLKKPPLYSNTTLPTAAATSQGPFYQTQTTNWNQTQSSNWTSNGNLNLSTNGNQAKQGFIRSLSSKSSIQTQHRVQAQNDMVTWYFEREIIFEKTNQQFIKLIDRASQNQQPSQKRDRVGPFLSEKVMEQLIQSKHFKPKDIIEDIYKVTSNYMYLLDKSFISKQFGMILIKFIQIITKDGTTKRYLYREICQLLSEKLDEIVSKQDEDKKISQIQIKQLEKQNENMNELSLQLEKENKRKFEEITEIHMKELGELNEKYEKLRNENLLLTDSVRQLKRDQIQQESDMKFYQVQSTNQFEARIKDLLQKFHSLEETSSKNDQHYSNQYECMNELVSNYQSAVVKLRLSKETINKQTVKIEQLLNEISRLNVRASTQFHNLTPRPSFQELEEICNQLSDPNYKVQEQTEKQKIPVIKFSDSDSASRIKKITTVIKQGFSEFQDLVQKLNSRKNDSLSFQNKVKNKQSTKASKIMTDDSKSTIKSKKNSLFQSKGEDSKKKKQPKKSKFEQGLQKIQRNSVQTNELNISDNLSLNSEDKQALQKQSIDEYEDSLNDF